MNLSGGASGNTVFVSRSKDRGKTWDDKTLQEKMNTKKHFCGDKKDWHGEEFKTLVTLGAS
ncbi:MAG: hypothetical protein JW957_07120, partial [Candidatus Omnitrophica bacterium]|nr:hypothetical protein [Candidatus Omnitrophota bacterium]